MTRFPKQLRIPLLPIMALIVASIVFAVLAASVSAAGGARDSGKDYTLVSGNDAVDGIWSDGTTMWVLDRTTPKVYAYVVSTKARDSNKDFDSLVTAGNGSPHGIWSDGTTMWISDRADDKIYAYSLSNGSTHSSKDIPLHADNGSAESIWSDGTTIWVANDNDDRLYAYNLSTKARDSGKDFSGLSAAGNSEPRGMWSDGVTMWVSDHADDKLYAYNVSDKTRVENPAGTYPQDFNLTSDNSSPQGVWSDGDTFWVANTFSNGDNANPNRKLYAYQSYPVATGVTARSVGPAIAQIIVSLDNILQGFSSGSTTPIHIRYRVASPPGAWTTVQPTASPSDTEIIHKITSGLVVGTEYDIEASVSSAFVPSISTTHTHLGTTILLWDVVVDKIWEVADISDVPGSDAELGDAMGTMNDVRALTEFDGWMYAVDQDRTFWRTRTPEDPSTYNQMGTFPSSAGSVHSLFVWSGSLYAVGSTYLFQIPNPLDASEAITIQNLPSTLTTVRGSAAVGGEAYIWDHAGYELWRVSGLSPGTATTATEVQLTGLNANHDVRGMTDFNGRFILHEEDTQSLDEIIGFAGTNGAVVSLGTYDSTVAGVNALASWSNNPAPIVSSVSIGSILDTSVTANITATAATAAGIDFRFRYRLGTSGNWTDASVSSATTTAAISLTGLTANQAYEYQASMDSTFPVDDKTTGTFTTVATTTQLGKVSGVVLTAPVDNGLTVTWAAVTTANSYRVRWATTAGGQSSTNEAVVSGVTYDIPGLSTNDEYFVQVRAETATAGYTSGLYSDEVSKLTTIPAPTNVITSATATTITVSWDAVTGATAYEVWYNVSGGTRFDITGSPLPTTYTITGLTTGTTYMVWTAAKIGSAEGRFSTRIDVTPAAPITAQAPTDVTLVAGFETITASWTAPTDTGNAAITGYVLEYQAKGASQWVAIDLSNVASHVIPSLTAGTTYTVRVATKNSAGTGPYSDKPYPSAKAEGPPDKPQPANGRISISADSSTLSQMEIYWPTPDGNGGGITSYDLRYRIVGNSNWITVNQSGTSYNATGLTLHEKYEMQVRATNSHGSSDYSNLANVKFSPRWLYMIQGSSGTGLSRWSGNSVTSLKGIFSDRSSDGSDLATLDNRLFAIRSGESKLYEIDPSTNSATEICTFTVTGNAYGLAGLSGDLYLYAGGSIYTLDESSCAVSLVGATGRSDLRGMTAADGVLLMTEIITANALYIWTVSPSDGSITQLTSSNTGSSHSIAANGYRLYIPTYRNAGGLNYISSRTLSTGREGQRNYGNAGIDQVNGVAVLTMIPPKAPTLDSVNPSVASLALTWTAPANKGTGSITGYSVQYKVDTSSTWVDWTFSGVGTSTTITGLQNGTSYDVRVAAKNVIGAGEYDESTSSTGTTIPGAPQSLVLTPTGGQIRANWTIPTITGGSAITGYSVQYKLETSSTWIDWSHTGTATTATITGLTNGAEYDVRVAAKNSIGTGTAYASESATPNIRLDAPSSITTTPGTDNITVNWGDVTDATGYVIQWSLTTGDYSASQGSTNQAVTATSSYQITGLAEDTEYFIRIKATA